MIKEKKEKVKKSREENYLKKLEYEKKLKEVTLKTFKDKPEKVQKVWV